ncbi:MAG TPA: hypothetical protein DGH68_07480 [Bacteroidetes bacterium]|nr:hypothetical protein [Bacteroidota bacterium]
MREPEIDTSKIPRDCMKSAGEPTYSIRSFFHHLQKSQLRMALLVAGLSWLLFAIVQLSGTLDALELGSLDWRFQLLPRLYQADSSVVLVAIDQNSLDFFEHQSVHWPWPRQFYGLLVSYLHRAGARVIAFDVDFSGHDIDRLEIEGHESDSAFADGMDRSGNVVLAAQLSIQEQGDQAGGSLVKRFILSGTPGLPSQPAFTRVVAPIQAFQNGAAKLGIVNFESDVDDICRRVSLGFRFAGGWVPHFSLASYAEANGLQENQLDSLLAARVRSNEGRHVIYWYGKGGPTGAFRYYSFHSLIYSELKIQQGLPPDVPLRQFAGKIVIVGGSAAGLFDFKPTPFTSLEPYPGMEIHATVLSNLLDGHRVREMRSVWPYLLGLVLSLAAALIFFMARKVLYSVPAVVAVGLLYGGIIFLVFYHSGWWVPLVGPEVSLSGTFLASAIVSYATEGRQKRQLRKAFNRYLSPQVVTEIVENVDQVELGGKLIEGTVYFSDIKDFTTISEQHSPKELVGLLNEYLSLASDCILRNDAMLDKYIGDAVMAIFSAPIPHPDHAKVACLTALEVQRTLGEYYTEKSKRHGTVNFKTRIGLNSGNMIVGNIGHTNRLDYTAIGDTVNLASRLEGVNKMFGTDIIVSESTLNKAGGVVRARELDFLRVKGKQIPIRIFELISENQALPDITEEKLGLFAEGLNLYRAKDFARAIARFEAILRIDPHDGPSTTLRDRCDTLSKEQLPDDWDGVFTLTSK